MAARAPVDEVVSLGRSLEVGVRVMSPTVARRHAALRWCDGAHVIEDLQSTNGIEINNRRVQIETLRDGDVVHMGEARMRYFIGDDAQARALVLLTERPNR